MTSFVIDHLFESTLFAILMGLLTLCFANNRASVRHGLWFAASVKFLIPFSLIVAAGEFLRWETAPVVRLALAWPAPAVSPDIIPSDLRLPTIFADVPVPDVIAPVIQYATPSRDLDMTTLLFAIWLAGIVFLLCRWTLQALQLHAARKASTPATLLGHTDLPIPVRFSPTLFEPGLVFKAWTTPELLKKWWAPASFGITFVSCEADVRVGGKVRFVFKHPAAPEPMAFFGTYLDVVANKRLVWTNEESPDGSITTVTFEEKGGATFVVVHDLYPSKDALDAAIASDSTGAFPEQFTALDALLAA